MSYPPLFSEIGGRKEKKAETAGKSFDRSKNIFSGTWGGSEKIAVNWISFFNVKQLKY